MESHNQQPLETWERQTIKKIALEGIKEQKRARRWKIFFMLLFFAYLAFIAFALLGKGENTPKYDLFGNVVKGDSKDHIALVRLSGAIAEGKDANAARLSKVLRSAASKDSVKGILIEANSPGGSPVQSSLVFQTIQDIKKTFNKPIKTVVTDVCASGCYYIVSATDEIYADKSSIVGSIGVISQSFGFKDAAEKLGINPRTYTAGENKDFMNPAREPSEKEIAFLKKLLADLHVHFIDAVKLGRGDKLANDPELFSGLFWTGEEAKGLGLIDGIATPQMVAQGMGEYPVYDYDAKPPIKQLLEQFGAEAQGVVSGSLEQMIESRSGIHFK